MLGGDSIWPVRKRGLLEKDAADEASGVSAQTLREKWTIWDVSSKEIERDFLILFTLYIFDES